MNHDQSADNGFTQQMQIKNQIERDIQRQVQNMLGTLMGFDKVITSVTADIDFTQENREENIVTPVDEENMKGISYKCSSNHMKHIRVMRDPVGGIPQNEDHDTITQIFRRN